MNLWPSSRFCFQNIAPGRPSFSARRLGQGVSGESLLDTQLWYAVEQGQPFRLPSVSASTMKSRTDSHSRPSPVIQAGSPAWDSTLIHRSPSSLILPVIDSHRENNLGNASLAKKVEIIPDTSRAASLSGRPGQPLSCSTKQSRQVHCPDAGRVKAPTISRPASRCRPGSVSFR